METARTLTEALGGYSRQFDGHHSVITLPDDPYSLHPLACNVPRIGS